MMEVVFYGRSMPSLYIVEQLQLGGVGGGAGMMGVVVGVIVVVVAEA
jgi:hypothetical protein